MQPEPGRQDPDHARYRVRAQFQHLNEDGLVSTGIGLREWLGTLPEGSSDVAVATFDTRITGAGHLTQPDAAGRYSG